MNEKLQMILTVGLPASGKSTWAKEQVALSKNALIRINRDDIRGMLHITKFSKQSEKEVTALQESLIRIAFANGRSVVIDDTNLNPATQDRLKAIADEHLAEVTVKHFDTPREVCILRDAARPNPVGPEVINRMYWQYVNKRYPRQKIDEDLPWAIICDLDGTLADFKTTEHRGPFDVLKCENDDIVEHVRDILANFFYEKGDRIIFVSGRDETARASTMKFLERCSDFDGFKPHNFPLLMRKEGDTRSDVIVKKEIYYEHIYGKYNVRFVLDDRDAVVNMWRRELGLFCLQVAEGSF